MYQVACCQGCPRCSKGANVCNPGGSHLGDISPRHTSINVAMTRLRHATTHSQGAESSSTAKHPPQQRPHQRESTAALWLGPSQGLRNVHYCHGEGGSYSTNAEDRAYLGPSRRVKGSRVRLCTRTSRLCGFPVQPPQHIFSNNKGIQEAELIYNSLKIHIDQETPFPTQALSLPQGAETSMFFQTFVAANAWSSRYCSAVCE